MSLLHAIHPDKELVGYNSFDTCYMLPFSHNQMSGLPNHAKVCLHPAITLVMMWYVMD